MNDELDHLDDEALLMLLVADELPADKRQALLVRMQSDAALAARFNDLRAAHEVFGRSIAALDRAQPLPPADSSARRARAAMNQWSARRLSVQPMRMVSNPWSARKFALGSLTAAAAVLFGWVAWWGMKPDTGMVRPGDDLPPDAEALADSFIPPQRLTMDELLAVGDVQRGEPVAAVDEDDNPIDDRLDGLRRLEGAVRIPGEDADGSR